MLHKFSCKRNFSAMFSSHFAENLAANFSFASSITPRWLGKVEYAEGVRLQETLRSQVDAKTAVVLGLEHPAVITLGKRGNIADDLAGASNTTARAIEGVAFHWSARGGQATLHSPGQLVIYPMLPIREWQIGVRKYVEILEETSLRFLKSFGVEAFVAADEPGIYTSYGKIVFFGIQVSRGVTSHGIAINVCNDLSLFRHIRSCGKTFEKFDQLRRYGITAPLNELFDVWTQHFNEVLRLTKTTSER